MAVMVESRSFRPFKSSEEYLYAMKEDLAEWLNFLYPQLYINVANFMDRLDTGVTLCKHANNVRKYAEEYVSRRQAAGKMNMHSVATTLLRGQPVRFLPGAKSGTFFARDNVSNFIWWCRHGLGVFECLLFETDDLIMRKNEKHVILCLLEVARRTAKLGMPAPMLVHLEREIDREIAADKKRLKFGGCQEDYYGINSEDEGSTDFSDTEDCMEYGPVPQIVTNDLKSLDEMVRDLVEKCQCPTQFPMIRVSEGKYRIGDTKVLIFVRVLRSHVMVRVGGGWDTLSHYLDKHDPCRCKSGHRTATSSKLVGVRAGNSSLELSHAQVHYDRSPPRTRRSSTSSNSSLGGQSTNYGDTYRNRSPSSFSRNRSPTPNNRSKSPSSYLSAGQYKNHGSRRSRSPASRKDKSNYHSRSPTPSSKPTTPILRRKSKPTTDGDPKKKDFIAYNKETTLNVPGSSSLSTEKSRKLSRDSRENYNVSRSRSPSAGKSRKPYRDTSNDQNVPRSRSPSAGKTRKPYRDTSNDQNVSRSRSPSAGKTRKPYRDTINDQNVSRSRSPSAGKTRKPYRDSSNDHSISSKDLSSSSGKIRKSCRDAGKLQRTGSIPDPYDTDEEFKRLENIFSKNPDRVPRAFEPEHQDPVGSSKIKKSASSSGIFRSNDNYYNDSIPASDVKSFSPSENFQPTQLSGMDTPNSSNGRERSGVDTTPFFKVSDNFADSSPSMCSRKGSISVNDLDMMSKKCDQQNNDSGSEVSDEGYKSLGLGSSPTAHSPLHGAPSPIGSPLLPNIRPPRSRSVGGPKNVVPSPHTSPFKRNTKLNQSARQTAATVRQPTTQQTANTRTKCPPVSSYATWNGVGGSKIRTRPALADDTFTQQMASIVKQYAALVPSPRKDRKYSDGRTRIPAPISTK